MRFFIAILICLTQFCGGQPVTSTLQAPGLQQSVEVYRDANGVNHIYAANEHDLFFAQGYCAARDRLFQFEIWRRQATGTVAEILGPDELNRDIGARLFKFRGNLKQELNHYHPRGEAIINAFTEGINTYILATRHDPTLLPIEFKLLGITPELWTPDVVISRHQGLLNNLTDEVSVARAVATLGEEKVKELMRFEPGEPLLTLHPSIKKEILFQNIIGPYEAFRKPLVFTPAHLKLSSNTDWNAFQSLAASDEKNRQAFYDAEQKSIGSNNWIVSGRKSQSGYPLLANDPHRVLAMPSLRYLVHLNAPGWNVVGGGEPTIPGVSIGHNDFGAWGLTIFQLDAEDLYVYELNPNNPKQYKYNGQWETMRSIADTIRVKGAPNVYVEHLFTRHGPVTHIDKQSNTAFAVRCGWLDIGAAPYLASLRINQAKTVNDFLAACTFSMLPAENMIWADRKGNIVWQAVGIAPVRKTWSGLVPVPGDGSFEWDGYLPIKQLPSVVNPANGFVATANENNVPANYKYRNAVGWQWAEPYRSKRIHEVLGAGKKFSQQHMMALQFDYVALPARELLPLLRNLKSADALTEQARQRVTNSAWNFELSTNSIEATIYTAWEKRLSTNLHARMVPDAGKPYIRSLSLIKVIEWIKNPPTALGSSAERDALLIQSLEEAVSEIKNKLGEDITRWQYGQAAFHHVLIKHPLSNAVDADMRTKLEVGPLPRGGYSHTPGMTTSSYNQQAGASFRMVVDTKDWDAAMFTNAPGQSGDPSSPYFKSLFELWASDKHFNVLFTKGKVVKTAKEKVILQKE